MHRNTRGPIPLWQIALYIALLGVVSMLLAPLTAVWWIVPLLGAAVPVLLATGKTNAEVAGALFISVGTVKSHSANIYRKLEAKNRTEAVARARELGVLP